MICKQCKVEVPKLFTGKIRIKVTKLRTQNVKVYFDDTGRQWSGLVCPTCYNKPKTAPKEKATCIDCEEEIVKKFTGKTTLQKSSGRFVNRKEYGDGNGGIWNGNICPPCNRESRAPKKRKDKKKCGCGEILPETRYFKCEDCQPHLMEDMGFETYA